MIGYRLNDEETQELLSVIAIDNIEPHYEASSLHIEEIRYIVGKVEYSFYYTIGHDSSIPTIEVYKIHE